MQVISLFILSLAGVVLSINYDGYKVFTLHPKNENDNLFLLSLEADKNFDFWSRINKVGNPVTVMVSPVKQNHFEKNLIAHKIPYRIEINNVESFIASERTYHRSKTLKTGEVAFDKYLNYDEINAYLNRLQEEYPDLVTVSSIGKSFEQRDMNIIRISSGPSPTQTPKPVIFIEAGMHAREWISPALALYIINQLVENPFNGDIMTKEVDWIVLPLMNPDGYEYTWNTNRLWRKTRSNGTKCDGVDGNRNFGFHWMEKGASSNECSETYAGPEEFSEVEARNLRDILNATENVQAFISLHSYGQLLFYPYSYDNVVPDNWEDLRELAEVVRDVIRFSYGTQYTIGASTEILYPAAGCSDDWAMGGAGIKTVLTFELPGGGPNGFDLPPEQIESVVQETFEGIKVIYIFIGKVWAK